MLDDGTFYHLFKIMFFEFTYALNTKLLLIKQFANFWQRFIAGEQMEFLNVVV